MELSPAVIVTIGHDSCTTGSMDSLTKNDAVAEAQAEEEEDVFPEGGRDAWLSVLGGFLAIAGSFGLSNSFGALQPYLAENQLADFKPSTVS